MVFDKILSAITVGLGTFPFSISIILTSFDRSALAIVIASAIYSIYFSYLVWFISSTLLLLDGG